MKCNHCAETIEVYDIINEYLDGIDGMNVETWTAECPNCGQKYILKEIWKRTDFELTEVESWYESEE